MKVINYTSVPVEEEIPFDMKHLQELFEDLTQNFDKIDFTNKDILDKINAGWIVSKDEIKQLPKLYEKRYFEDDFCRCKEEVDRILDTFCIKYSSEDVESCINDYFG